MCETAHVGWVKPSLSVTHSLSEAQLLKRNPTVTQICKDLVLKILRFGCDSAWVSIGLWVSILNFRGSSTKFWGSSTKKWGVLVAP